MIRFAMLALFALACGSAEDGELFDEADGGDALGTAEQEIQVHQVYGVQKSGSNRQLRCVAGASSDCMVPEYKKLMFTLNTNGISLNGDRALFQSVWNAEVNKAQGRDNGMNMILPSGSGLPSQTVDCYFQPQSSFSPASSSSTDIRKYVGGYVYGGEFDHGTYRQFEDLIVKGNFSAMKAHKGGTCANTSTNQCVRGMRHMAQAAIAACVGAGLTSNSSANGTGVDIDVTTNNTPDFSTSGDVCRQKAYDHTVVGVSIITSPNCAL